MLRRFLRSSAASASAEFAFCAPFLITLVIGAEELGRAFWCHHMLVQMARDATRYLTRIGSPGSSTYQTNATHLALYGNLAGSGNPLMPASFGTAVSLSYALTNVGGTWTGVSQYVTTTVSFSFSSTWIGWLGLGVTIPMTVAHSERVQSD
jgi:Flp pilus assembly protein TadG